MKDLNKLNPSSKQLTKNDVLRIWTMRAGGAKNQDVALDVGFQPQVCSAVITKGAGPEVPIPHGIRKAALETVRHYKKASSNKPTAPISESIPAYIEACSAMEKAKAECLNAGVSEETLRLLLQASQEQVSNKA